MFFLILIIFIISQPTTLNQQPLFRLENIRAECLSSNQQICAFVYIHRYSTLGEIGNNRTPVQ